MGFSYPGLSVFLLQAHKSRQGTAAIYLLSLPALNVRVALLRLHIWRVFAFPFRRETKTKPLIAAGHLCLEWVSPCIGTTQKSIPGSTGFVLPNKHSVVVVGAFVEDSCPDAGFDDLAVDTTLQKIGKHPAVIFRCRRQKKFLRLFRLGNRRNIAGVFPA